MVLSHSTSLTNVHFERKNIMIRGLKNVKPTTFIKASILSHKNIKRNARHILAIVIN